MKLYIAPAAAVAAFQWTHSDEGPAPLEAGGHIAQTAPGNPNLVLVLVLGEWASAAAAAAWEGLPGVVRIYPEMLAGPVPAAIANAFASVGVLPTDTGRQALNKIRAWWPHPALS